jgi:antitoxin YokJ
VLLASTYEKNRESYDNDRSNHWFLIARGIKMDQLKITIDLLWERNRFCYDSFWDVYATGNSKIVARSFTDLLDGLYRTKGRSVFWDSSEFNIGFAYDDVSDRRGESGQKH